MFLAQSLRQEHFFVVTAFGSTAFSLIVTGTKQPTLGTGCTIVQKSPAKVSLVSESMPEAPGVPEQSLNQVPDLAQLC